MVELSSKEYKCFPSFTSHNMAVPSLPPEPHKEPSGEMVMVYRTPVCPAKLVFSLQLFRFQTLINLSQPQETISGFLAEGENLTQETQSVWFSSVMVYLHSARVFHSLMVLSRDPETI